MGAIPAPAYSALMALAASCAIGCVVYVAARFAGVVGSPLLYHAFVYGAFFGLYMTLPGGFEGNFTVPGGEKKKMTVADVMYYTMTVHTTTGFGEHVGKSFYARCLTAAHMGLVFLATASLIPLGR